MKSKSLRLTLEQHAAIVAAARACGFTVRLGRGSQLAEFVTLACQREAGRRRKFNKEKR